MIKHLLGKVNVENQALSEMRSLHHIQRSICRYWILLAESLVTPVKHAGACMRVKRLVSGLFHRDGFT
jgi:hypothetical protein